MPGATASRLALVAGLLGVSDAVVLWAMPLTQVRQWEHVWMVQQGITCRAVERRKPEPVIDLAALMAGS